MREARGGMSRRTVEWSLLYPDEEAGTRMVFRRGGRDDDLDQLRRLCSGMKRVQRGARSAGGAPSFAANPKGWRQFVTVKFRYGKSRDAAVKFLDDYLTQEGREEVGAKPLLFDSAGCLDEARRGAARASLTARHFKFMLSPESRDVPLEVFARTYMERLEHELGLAFQWTAAVHTNTPHPHVHILVNGRDRLGRPLPSRPFPPGFVKWRSREVASEIATAMVGPRSAEQREASWRRSFGAARWTAHDMRIRELSGGGLRLAAENVGDDVRRRLSTLCGLGLAGFSGGVFILRRNWDSALRNAGRYTSFLKAREELKWTLPEDLRLYTHDVGPVRGRVRRTYTLDDEFENDNAVLLEGDDGRAFFVPLFNPPPRGIEGRTCEILMESRQRGRLVPRIRVVDGGGRDAR